MLQPQGYYILEELIDALGVRASFLESEIADGELVSSLTMYGTPWFRHDTVLRWLRKREVEIAAEQIEFGRFAANNS